MLCDSGVLLKYIPHSYYNNDMRKEVHFFQLFFLFIYLLKQSLKLNLTKQNHNQAAVYILLSSLHPSIA